MKNFETSQESPEESSQVPSGRGGEISGGELTVPLRVPPRSSGKVSLDAVPLTGSGGSASDSTSVPALNQGGEPKAEMEKSEKSNPAVIWILLGVVTILIFGNVHFFKVAGQKSQLLLESVRKDTDVSVEQREIQKAVRGVGKAALREGSIVDLAEAAEVMAEGFKEEISDLSKQLGAKKKAILELKNKLDLEKGQHAKVVSNLETELSTAKDAIAKATSREPEPKIARAVPVVKTEAVPIRSIPIRAIPVSPRRAKLGHFLTGPDKGKYYYVTPNGDYSKLYSSRDRAVAAAKAEGWLVPE